MRVGSLTLTRQQYSFFNNFSGQIAYESWTISFYNVIFTVLPPLVIGIFDQFVSARVLDRYPQLYALGQKNVFFTKTAFWMWIGNALYHSLILFGFSVILFWGDLKQATGLDSGHWFWGTALYLAVLLTVLGKAALISECVPVLCRLSYANPSDDTVYGQSTRSQLSQARLCLL